VYTGNPTQPTVKRLFSQGLDKALLQLDSSNAHLIKPILVLMGNIAEWVPHQHRYLLVAIQNTLTNNPDKYLKEEKYCDLIVEFLVNSKCTFDLQKLTPPQQRCL
jgi:hypothetical protein